MALRMPQPAAKALPVKAIKVSTRLPIMCLGFAERVDLRCRRPGKTLARFTHPIKCRAGGAQECT